MNIEIPSTIQEQIDIVNSYDISYKTLHDKAIIHNKSTDTNIMVPFSSIVSKYKNFLYEIIIPLTSDDINIQEYRFKPKALSEELYGTTEFWDIILNLNNCKSVIDFDVDPIYVYDPTRFKEYLTEIIITEESINS